MIALAAAAAALAHPVGDRAAAQTTALVVRPGAFDVDYYADVPDALVRTAGGDDVIRAMTVELATGLLATVDGQVVSMRLRAPSPPPQRTSEHTLGFVVHLEGPLPPRPRTIEVHTSNLLDAANFYAGDVHVDPSLRVTGCSLHAEYSGRVVRDDTLRWTQGEDRRTLAVTLGDPWPAWWTAVAPGLGAGMDPIRAAKARPPTGWDCAMPGIVTPAGWIVALGLAALLGATSSEGRGRAAGLAVAALGVALALAPHPPSGTIELVAGSATAVAAAIPRTRWLAPAVATAGLAGDTHGLWLAIGVVAAHAVGSVAARGRTPGTPRVALAVAVAVALGLVVRGLVPAVR